MNTNSPSNVDNLIGYIEKYEFKILTPVPSFETIDELKEEIEDLKRNKILKNRRKALQELLARFQMMEELQADLISLPLKWNYYHGRFEVPPGTYIGGIERYIESVVIHLPETRRLIYTGVLPIWVRNKYLKARHYFSPSRLIVVSKNPQLFSEAKAIVRNLSPLLIAIERRNDDLTQFLLAAWGLENELPKSLGGILEEKQEENNGN